MNFSLLISMVVAGLAAGAHAQLQQPDQPSAAAALSEGEVRKVDKQAGKLTLRHGRIENLDMPPMTMVFRASDPKMLDGLNEGDKVRFAADRVDGAITVTRIETTR
ncbi:copper-binding protein [Piscinibacter sp. XHJ-5]|uniref:copper-binding protein n=1 Tax=Piscinibacter sp. XHJ-5 TaxID=3037797 RepID=UPI002452C890|nr:copper-binding protein [Piscinibacter sp. XHJ-5]